MNTTITNQFIELISDTNGNISSRRFTKTYFEKQNKPDLWEWFETQIKIFEGYSNRDIILCLKYGYIEPPKCIVCNKNAKVQKYDSNITFDYCSKECSLISTKRSNNISITKKNYTNEEKESIESKRRNTNLKKYGSEYQSQRPEVKTILSEKASIRQIDQNVKNLLTDNQWLYNEYITEKKSASHIAYENGIYYGTVIDHLKKHQFIIRKGGYKISVPQLQIYDYIKSIYDGEILYDDWNTLNTLELDIYIPELKLAIEHNGLKDHSTNIVNNKNKIKHLRKTLLCEELNIDLLHIRGDQWIKKKEIIKSIIKHKLNKTDNKIYARKCEIKEVFDGFEFLQTNHIQGFASGKYDNKMYGLYYNNELVSLITFCRPRITNSKGDWELLRFCNKLYTNVIGGFSKLLSHFKKMHKGKIISYCDRSISNGNVYVKNGFELISTELKPTSWWTDRHTVWYRSYSFKSNIKKQYELGKFKYYNDSESQTTNMFKNGFYVYYDSGQLTYLLP